MVRRHFLRLGGARRCRMRHHPLLRSFVNDLGRFGSIVSSLRRLSSSNDSVYSYSDRANVLEEFRRGVAFLHLVRKLDPGEEKGRDCRWTEWSAIEATAQRPVHPVVPESSGAAKSRFRTCQFNPASLAWLT